MKSRATAPLFYGVILSLLVLMIATALFDKVEAAVEKPRYSPVIRSFRVDGATISEFKDVVGRHCVVVVSDPHRAGYGTSITCGV